LFKTNNFHFPLSPLQYKVVQQQQQLIYFIYGD
jgi:hypothetical protein